MTRLGIAFIVALATCERASSTKPESSTDQPPVTKTPAVQDNEPRATATDPPRHILGLSDAQLAAKDAVAASTEARRALLAAGTRGVRIDAPFEVDGTASEVPAIGFRAIEGASEAAFSPGGWWVGVQLDRPGFLVGSTVSAKMAGGGKMPAGGKMAGGGKMPAGGEPTTPSGGVVSEAFRFDLRAVLPTLSWGKGAVRVHAVHGGDVSNGVTITAAGGEPSTPPMPPAIAHAAGPDTQGSKALSLHGPGSAVTEPGAEVMLEGAVQGPGDQAAVFLFATDGTSTGPFVARIDTPLTEGRGTFAVNLLGDNPLPKAPGTWHVYAFSGEHVAGPATIELTPGSKPW